MIENEKIFDNIIGYNNIKTTLKRIIDILNNQNKYKKLGVTIPHGLFLYGPPGIGKSSIANEFINNTKRKSYTIRKSKSDESFIDYLNNIFEMAKANQPSIILLDDLDKFSEKNCNEEYVSVQSLIDDVKDKEVFIIATVNDKNVLPNSLLRSGRFDVKIKLDYPSENDSFEIIKYYLKKKKIDKDVNIKNISYILNGSSCADLEKVCNQAGIYSGYLNKDTIGMNELVRASLELKYDTNIEEFNSNDKYALNVAYHEAGHALIGELFEPGSISFITIAKSDSNTRGMTIYHQNDNYFDDIEFMKNRVKTLLAGKASTEIVYQASDVGCNSDLHRVYEITSKFIDNYCMLDFNSWIRTNNETSEKVKQSKVDNINKIITDYYNEVKELLIMNRSILDNLAKTLSKKKILFQDEIEKIVLKNNKMKVNI